MSVMECGHCGGTAATPLKDGYFYEGMSDRCEDCGYPGQVIVEEPDDDGVAEAHWSTSEGPGARCRRPNCDDGCEDDT